MAIITFPVRGFLVFVFSVAAFAVPVVSIPQLQHFADFLVGIVTAAAFFDRVSFLPDIFPVFIDMMAFSAGITILGRMLLVMEFDRALSVNLVTMVFNHDHIRHVKSSESSHGKKNKGSKDKNSK